TARRLSPPVRHPQPAAPPGDLGAGPGSAHPVADRDLSDQRLARARDLRLLRNHLRRPPLPDPDPDAGRLGGPPAAQGLPARRNPRRVQGSDDSTARPAEGLQLMADDTRSDTVLTVSGQDWDAISDAVRNADDERIVVNMGPQHPSTHGVLRLIL